MSPLDYRITMSCGLIRGEEERKKEESCAKLYLGIKDKKGLINTMS